LLLYTDGLTEARNRAGEFFPLLEHAEVLRSGTIEEALDALLDRVRGFVPGGLGDDLAAVLLERAVPSNADPLVADAQAGSLAARGGAAIG
jgi:serine phosphatase RsbU (regulator of sigma subunit)